MITAGWEVFILWQLIQSTRRHAIRQTHFQLQLSFESDPPGWSVTMKPPVLDLAALPCIA